MPAAPAADTAGREPRDRGAALRPLLLLGGAVTAVLLATSWRYGYHRDELYFIAAGRHPSWGYADQPPFTPLLLAAMNAIAQSLVLTRLPSALAAGASVLLTGLIAREMGGGRRAQLLAGTFAAVSAVNLVTGHFVTTTTFDVLFSALLCWLVARTIRTGDERLLLPAGLALGVGLLNKDLVGIMTVALLIGIAVAGPWALLRSRWLLAGGVVAVLLGLPYVIWQAGHGWPQVEMTRVIARSGDEGGRAGFIPFQLILVSPLLVPVWIAGLVRLLRTPAARPFRAFGVMYPVLAVIFLVTGGKAYYMAGAYPVLLGAGGIATDGWLASAAGRARAALLGAAVGLSAAVGAVIGLAVLPVSALPGSPIMAVNPDAAETVGWPAEVDTVARVWNGLPPADRAHAVILALNYGEAGALELYGPSRGLPTPYSGHNAFSDFAVPPDDAAPVVVIGYEPAYRDEFFTACRLAARVDNGYGLDNEEQGHPIWVCEQLRQPWRQMWPRLRHIT
jgi:Dolichyl-phosphate-mannose-protein mannosyltransferase